MNSTCLVLRPGASRHKVREVLESVGLHLADVLQGDGQRLSQEEIWAKPDRTQVVAIVEDPLVHVVYLAIRGKNERRLAAALQSRIPTYTQSESIALARDAIAHDDRVRAIYRIAVMFPYFDAHALEIFRTFAMDAQDPTLREATVDAMLYRSWPEFIPLLEQMARDDRADSVRQRVADVLAHLQAAGRKQ